MISRIKYKAIIGLFKIIGIDSIGHFLRSSPLNNRRVQIFKTTTVIH